MIIARRALVLAVLSLSACGRADRVARRDSLPGGLHPGETPEIRRLIDRWAAEYRVPPLLVHRVVQRESDYDPKARNGPYYGLMQILPQTARTMGHRGPASELLDPGTNLRYGVRYLRGAWLVADGDMEKAIGWFARGYYYEAKRRGLLEETGLKAA